MVESLAKLGVTIDLLGGKWRTADGRSGTTDPFTTDKQAAAAADATAGLPPPRAAMAPVSLASVMRERASGKDASMASAGLGNQKGEYNCFLNVVVQALWHVDAFRKALQHASSPDALRELVPPQLVEFAYGAPPPRMPLAPPASEPCAEAEASAASAAHVAS